MRKEAFLVKAISYMRNIKIFDTTLRDGEQSPGCSMSLEEKLEIARQLERLHVDVIEAGMPVSSKGDFDSVYEIASKIKNSAVCALARALPQDIDAAYNALKIAESPRIHLFIATSPIHMEAKLKMSQDQVIERTYDMVSYAKKLMEDIEFSAEDATRSKPEFLCDVVSAAIKAGATTINIPDTVGYTTPAEMKTMIEYLKTNAVGADKVTFSVHCHNDLGSATANSLAGILGGADQVECTVNGIGERAGNTALEEVVMALKTRKDIYNADCNIDTKQIWRTSKLVYNITGQQVPLTKAIVGANAFSHESGIHQHGIMSAKETYEIISPEDIGKKPNKMVLGKHSGKHAFEERLGELGVELTNEQLDVYFEKFKQICDKKKSVTDRDLEALIRVKNIAGVYELDRFDVHAGNHTSPTCIIRLKRDDKFFEEVAIGDGPIAAAYNAIDKIMKLPPHTLDNYTIRSTSEGNDTLGEVMVKISCEGNKYNGRGLSTDIIEASILAYLHAANKFVPIG